jgi:hypothetical protein
MYFNMETLSREGEEEEKRRDVEKIKTGPLSIVNENACLLENLAFSVPFQCYMV